MLDIGPLNRTCTLLENTPVARFDGTESISFHFVHFGAQALFCAATIRWNFLTIDVNASCLTDDRTAVISNVNPDRVNTNKPVRYDGGVWRPRSLCLSTGLH